MSAQQMNLYQGSSFPQLDNAASHHSSPLQPPPPQPSSLSPSPSLAATTPTAPTTPTTPTTPAAAAGPISGCMDNQLQLSVNTQNPQRYAYSPNLPIFPTTERDMSQPLDLSVSRGAPSASSSSSSPSSSSGEGKRNIDESGAEEDGSAKRARTENDIPGLNFSLFGFDTNGSTSVGCYKGIPIMHNHDYYSPSYSSSMPFYSPSTESEKSAKENTHHAAPSVLPQQYSSSSPSSSDVLTNPPYCQDTQGRPLFGSEPTTASSSQGAQSDVKDPKPSAAAINLGLPIPHNSVFTRSVSPLFQQSWHHSPMSVSSHVHKTLFHSSATTVSPHVHPDVFQPPLPSTVLQPGLTAACSSSASSSSLSISSVSLQGHGSQHHTLDSSFSPYFPRHNSGYGMLDQNNVAPSSSACETVLPSPSQLSTTSLPPASSIVPMFPPKTFSAPSEGVVSAQQNTLSPEQHCDLQAPQQKPQQSPSEGSGLRNETSPRPFYRPFEDILKPSSHIASALALSPNGCGNVAKSSCGYRSEGEETVSSSMAVSCSIAPVSTCSLNHTPSTDQLQSKAEKKVKEATLPKTDETKENPNVTPLLSLDQPDLVTIGLSNPKANTSVDHLRASIMKPKKSASPTNYPITVATKPSSYKGQSKAKINPIQDNAVLSSTSLEPPPVNKPTTKGRHRKPLNQPFKVIGTTPLAKIRKDREEQEARAREERLRMFMARRQEYLRNGVQCVSQTASNSNNEQEANSNDNSESTDEEGCSQSSGNKNKGRSDKRDGGIKSSIANCELSPLSSTFTNKDTEVPSSSEGGAGSQSNKDDIDGNGESLSPGDRLNTPHGSSPYPMNNSENSSSESSNSQPSSSSSKSKTADGAPIPPDPNLKISPLDYLISKVLVEHIDIPFKPVNREIRAIYTGAKKGRLSLVDLIELQVEASLKA